MTEWSPNTGKRTVGRPVARWTNDIVAMVGISWIRLEQTKRGPCPAVGEIGLWMMMMMMQLEVRAAVKDWPRRIV